MSHKAAENGKAITVPIPMPQQNECTQIEFLKPIYKLPAKVNAGMRVRSAGGTL